MYITSIEKKIKQHTLILNDIEVERYREHTDEWIDLLDTLLIGKTGDNGDGSALAKRAKVKKAAAKRRNKTSGPGIEGVECPKCGMTVKARGLMIHQRGSKCRARAGYSTPTD